MGTALLPSLADKVRGFEFLTIRGFDCGLDTRLVLSVPADALIQGPCGLKAVVSSIARMTFFPGWTCLRSQSSSV
jgi:hypothetical protein